MTRVRFCLGLSALALALVAISSGAPLQAQDSGGGVAPPTSQSPAATPLRDPTRAPSWRRVLGSRSGVNLPQMRLRGRVVSRRGAIGLLEIEGQLHVVRPGDQLTLRLKGPVTPAATRRGRGRNAQPAAARGPQTLTLRVRKLDARVLELELVELSQTLTLR